MNERKIVEVEVVDPWKAFFAAWDGLLIASRAGAKLMNIFYYPKWW